MKYNLEVTRRLFQQRCKAENDRYLSRLNRWFYTIKALICIWLNLDTPPKGSGWYMEHIIACYTKSGTSYIPGEPTSHWASFIVVGDGVLSNWFAYETEDSD